MSAIETMLTWCRICYNNGITFSKLPHILIDCRYDTSNFMTEASGNMVKE